MPATTTAEPSAPPGRRRGILVVLGVVAVAALAWVAWTVLAGGGDEYADEAEAAASWVATEFDQPTPRWLDFGPGVNADIVMSLTAVGTEDETADAALEALVAESDVSLGGEPGAALPGSLAKMVLAVAARGEDPASYVAGRDVEAELRGLIGADGYVAGASVYDQALAVLALSATDDGVPAATADWLAAAQCDAGDFSYGGECPVAAGGEDPDTTALALQALLAGGETEAAEAATTWLLEWQGEDGSVSSFGTANANSTASVAQALRAAGEGSAADRAAAYVASLQETGSVDAGAIRFTAEDPAPDAFATIQGMLAFGAPALDQIEASGPAVAIAVVR